MSLFIPSGAVLLEAILRTPRDGALRGAAVVCHPHPVYGGTMNNRVVFRTAKAATEARLAALRFNFRGVGASSGSFDEGLGEQDDVVAAIAWLIARYPRLPLTLAGFSFGAWVGLQVGCRHDSVQALIGLGLPLNFYNFDFLMESSKPAVFIVGTQDEYCDPKRLSLLERRLPASSGIRRVEGADHFFKDQLDEVQRLAMEFLLETKFKEVGG